MTNTIIMFSQEMYDLLISSMNDQLTTEEDKQLQQALKGSSELREEKIKLIKVGELLSSRNYSFSVRVP